MGRVGRAFTVVRRSWGEFVGPEAGTRESVVILGVAAVGAAAAPAVVRRRGGASRWDEVVAGVLALDLWGGAWADNTRACARWYERPGQGDAEHYGFAALHVHPVLVVWLDRAEPRRVPGWAWAGAHYAYLVAATVAIRRLSRHRRVLGVALTAGGPGALWSRAADRCPGTNSRRLAGSCARTPSCVLDDGSTRRRSDR